MDTVRPTPHPHIQTSGFPRSSLAWAFALTVVVGALAVALALAHTHLTPGTGKAPANRAAIVATPSPQPTARIGQAGGAQRPCAAYDSCAYVPMDGVLGGAASVNGEPVDMAYVHPMALSAGQPVAIVFTVTNSLTATFTLSASQYLQVVDMSLPFDPVVWSGPVHLSSSTLGPLGVITGTVTWDGADSRGKPVPIGPGWLYAVTYNLEVQGITGYTGWTGWTLTNMYFPQVGVSFSGPIQFTFAPGP